MPLEALILDNYYRTKTPEQKVREGMVLEEVESERANERMKSGVKSNPMENSSTGFDKGKTRDIIARKVGLSSGRTFSGAKSVVEKIDKLKESGNTED